MLSQGDNELLLDVKNIFCVKLLLLEAGKHQNVKLTETLDLPEQSWIESSEGHYTGEFFTFNKNVAEPAMRNSFVQQSGQENIQCYFPIGSEWLFAKIYCGKKTAGRFCQKL